MSTPRMPGEQVRLGAAIVHADWMAERRAWVMQQRRALAVLSHLQVVVDTQRQGAWPTTRRAWLMLSTQQLSHCLVISDDMLPVAGFAGAALRAVTARPEHALTFYSIDPHVLTAREHGADWLVTRGGLGGTACVLPLGWVREFVHWADDNIRADYHRGEDRRLRMWLLATDRLLWTSVPSLVQHVGQNHSILHRQGIPNRARLLAADAHGLDFCGADYRGPARWTTRENWREIAKFPEAVPW